MTKAQQLKKNKKGNPKKFSKPENDAFHETIYELSSGKCQLCYDKADDYHHPYFGSYGAEKDDRYQLAVCRRCHNECHKSKHGAMNSRAKQIAHENKKVHDERG